MWGRMPPPVPPAAETAVEAELAEVAVPLPAEAPVRALCEEAVVEEEEEEEEVAAAAVGGKGVVEDSVASLDVGHKRTEESLRES